jgi:hypothetical protein
MTATHTSAKQKQDDYFSKITGLVKKIQKTQNDHMYSCSSITADTIFGF